MSDAAADEIVAAAEYQTEGDNTYGAMVFESTGDETMWWHAQLRQNGVFLYQNGSYILTFRVRAVEARTIRVQILGGGLTTRPTALTELPVAVTTEWTTKTINFIAPSAATNAELQFGLGPDSFLPDDLTDFARSSAEIHLDDVKIELGEPLPNQAPTISGGDVLATKGTAVLVKSGLTVRDDYDAGLALSDVQAVDITNGPKLDAANPAPGIYTFVYSLADSEGLVGSHTRKIYVTDPQQLMTNTEFKLNGDKGLPTGWDKSSEDNRGGQNISYGVRPVVLPETMLGNLINGDFSDTSENLAFENKYAWNVFQGAPLTATSGVTAGEFAYDISAITPDANFWDAQLRQENIRLPKGNFSLEFRAKAAEARTIRVALAGGGIVAVPVPGRAINETPVVLTTGWETYSIDFTATAHSYGSLLQFFFGPDSLLPDGTGGTVDLKTAYNRKFGKVWIDDVTFRYEDAQSPVATMIPALSVELWRIGADGMPWENQLKYNNLPFVTGDYKLNFSAHALATRKVMLVAENGGGVDQPRIGAVPTFTPTPQRFSFDMSFAANATDSSHFFGFFMGSYEKYDDFKAWWPNIADTTLSAADNVLTTIYLYDFSIDRV